MPSKEIWSYLNTQTDVDISRMAGYTKLLIGCVRDAEKAKKNKKDKKDFPKAAKIEVWLDS